MSGRVILRIALVTLLLLLIQSTVILPIRIGGMHPDLLWLLPITAALLAGPETGAVVGFLPNARQSAKEETAAASSSLTSNTVTSFVITSRSRTLLVRLRSLSSPPAFFTAV